MDTLLANTPTPTVYGWLCIVVVACALVLPKGFIAVDRLLARQPAQSEWSGWLHGLQETNAIQPPVWPRVITAIGGAFLFAALLTLMFFYAGNWHCE